MEEYCPVEIAIWVMSMIGNILYALKAIRFLPAYIVSKRINSDLISYERDRWLELNGINQKGLFGFLTLMMNFPEFRSLLYHRTGCQWLRHFGKGQLNLYFHTPSDKIGKGLMIWHGYSTVINAQSIGENCSIWHNVTIGKKTIDSHLNDKPVIGSNVSICTGSIVLGDIIVASGVTIGAAAIVVEDIKTENAVVIGEKAHIKNLRSFKTENVARH